MLTALQKLWNKPPTLDNNPAFAFRKTTILDDMALCGEDVCLSDQTHFVDQSADVSIQRHHTTGTDGYGSMQHETTLTIKNKHATALCQDNTAYGRTRLSITTDQFGTQTKELTNPSAQEKCREINAFFKSYPFAAQILCSEGDNEIERTLREKGHTIIEGEKITPSW